MMNDTVMNIPHQYENILNDSGKVSFNMASDLFTGNLLKTLTASRQNGRILELGTGSGLATSWIAAGMSDTSKLLTVENNEILINIAKTYIPDNRIEFIHEDAYKWLVSYKGKKFDLIFADAMPGKYDLFEEAFSLLNIGGFYIVDDMLPQTNWPEGHDKKASALIIMLENRTDISITKLNWSTGIIIITKIK